MTERRRIPLLEPSLTGGEKAYLEECLATSMVSSVGPFVGRFERDLAARVGAPHAVATINGTAALHVAVRLAGVEPGDEVLVSTLTFIAPANAVRYAGARPVFADAEPSSGQLDVERLGRFLAAGTRRRDGRLINRTSGRRIAALLAVHVLGQAVDLDPLRRLAERYDLPLIEDASQALGTRYRGRPVGSGSRLACFSFNGNKIVTTGGGGMLVTDDPQLARRARYLTTQARDDAVEYVHREIGHNYRLSNLHAAVGCAQLEALDDFLAAKRRIAARYDRAFAELPGLTPLAVAPWAESNHWLYAVRLDESAFGLPSRRLLAALDAAGIESRPLWQPLHLSPAHRGAQAVGGEVAEALYRQCLCLPSSAGLAPADQQRVIDACRDAHRRAAGGRR